MNEGLIQNLSNIPGGNFILSIHQNVFHSNHLVVSDHIISLRNISSLTVPRSCSWTVLSLTIVFWFDGAFYIWVVQDFTDSHTTYFFTNRAVLPAVAIMTIHHTHIEVTWKVCPFTKERCLCVKRGKERRLLASPSNHLPLVYPSINNQLSMQLITINPSIHHPTYPPTCLPTSEPSVSQSVGWSVGWSDGQSVSGSASQSASQLVSQAINHSFNQRYCPTANKLTLSRTCSQECLLKWEIWPCLT